MNEPKLWADSMGVWRQDNESQSPFGINWGEIFRIGGYRMGIKEDPDTVIELIFEFGAAMEINSRWEGYDEAIKGIIRQFPQIDEKIFFEINSIIPEDEIEYIEIWKK